MRHPSRPIAFALALCSGIAVCYVFAYGSITAEAPVQSDMASAVGTGSPAPPDPQPTPAELIRFGPIDNLAGFTNTTTVTLRRSPEASAPVFVTLNMPEQVTVKILEATRDFIRVKFTAPTMSGDGEEVTAEYEGWADWGTVIPHMTAIVLDADTGAVVSRVPLTSGEASVRYSPDGSRAIFYGTEGSGGSTVGYEVTTPDYTLARCVLASDVHLVRPVFYSPVDGALAAFGGTAAGGEAHLSLMRLSDSYTFDMPTKISAAVTGFTVSADGRTGFIFHPRDGKQLEKRVDVVDLQSLEILNTISRGGEQASWPERFAVSRDGSEIYLEQPETDSVAVLDTLTGQQLREFSKKFAHSGWLYYTQGSLVGDSLFVKYSNEGDDEMHDRPRAAWLNATGHVAADPEIESVIEAGGSGFAVNAEGTFLFRLDKEHHISERLPIEHPDLRQNQDAAYGLTVQGLSASPDGKHIIVFVGVYEGC
jgi:DNA-binding beta-propeller fold protein YncE